MSTSNGAAPNKHHSARIMSPQVQLVLVVSAASIFFGLR
jgi:hypothetical protein